MYPLVSELAEDGIPVAGTCRVLGVARQRYYRWLKQPYTNGEYERAQLGHKVYDAHRDDPEFGYRFLTDEVRSTGTKISEYRVWEICSEHQWWSRFTKKHTKANKAGGPVCDDLVQRQFTASRPNELWLTDITEHPKRNGKLYVCAVKDVYSNRIVGYSIDSRMKAQLVVNALRTAVLRRGVDVAGCVVHSDRGSQFRAKKYQRELARHGLAGSMGRVGAAGDNAAMEWFFSLLQKNVFNKGIWASRDDLRIETITWMERVYNHRRRQRRLNRLTPVEYETKITTTTVQAA